MKIEIKGVRADMLAIFGAALRAVEGRACVKRCLSARAGRFPVYLVAVGKAAASMTLGALEAMGEDVLEGLVITKSGHLDPALRGMGNLRCLESAHPVPDHRSLAAGDALIDFLGRSPEDARFLFLISGGASSLVEVLPSGVHSDQLARVNEWLLASGLAIADMNRVRTSLSMIKGGRLRRWLAGRHADVIAISDVPGDDPAVIGSGLLAEPGSLGDNPMPALPGWVGALRQGVPDVSRAHASQVTFTLAASPKQALQAAEEHARILGYRVTRYDSLITGDAEGVAPRLIATIADQPAGFHVWAGETTVRLPPRPGRGGRNQHLALAAAMEMRHRPDLVFLAAGTDGSDGPTEDAGALVDAGTVGRGALEGLDAARCLRDADAGRFLAASGDLIHTGPTGTNVMDLMLGLKLG